MFDFEVVYGNPYEGWGFPVFYPLYWRVLSTVEGDLSLIGLEMSQTSLWSAESLSKVTLFSAGSVILLDYDPTWKRELVCGPLQGIFGYIDVTFRNHHDYDGATAPHLRRDADGLPVGMLHPLLEPVCLGDVDPFVLPEHIVGVWHDLEEEVIPAEAVLQNPVGGDARRLKRVVADLAILQVDELDGDGELFIGITHCKLDYLGAGDAPHVLTPGIGHPFYLPEVSCLHGLSKLLHDWGLKKIMLIVS